MPPSTLLLSESGARELICGGSLKRHRFRTRSPSSHPLRLHSSKTTSNVFFYLIVCSIAVNYLFTCSRKAAIKGALLGTDWIDIRDRAVGDAVWRCWFMETRNQRPSVPCLHTQPWPLCSSDVHTQATAVTTSPPGPWSLGKTLSAHHTSASNLTSCSLPNKLRLPTHLLWCSETGLKFSIGSCKSKSISRKCCITHWDCCIVSFKFTRT